MKRKFSYIIAAMGMLTATMMDTSARAANSDPITIPPGVQVLHDVPYGTQPLQKMDVYLPPTQRFPSVDTLKNPAPVIFMVHGGGWRNGDKQNYNVVQNKLNRWVPKGFVLVSVNYDLLPQADLFQQEKDVETALAKAQQLAPRWNADPRKFIVMGHSAGAHLTSLMNADPSKAYALGAKPWLGEVSLDSAVIDVVAVMSAPHLPLYDAAFGSNPAVWRALSPYNQVTKDSLPWFGVCSSQRLESCPDSKNYALKAKLMGDKASVQPENLSHEEINETLGLPGAYTEAVESFMSSLDKTVARLLGPVGVPAPLPIPLPYPGPVQAIQ